MVHTAGAAATPREEEIGAPVNFVETPASRARIGLGHEDRAIGWNFRSHP